MKDKLKLSIELIEKRISKINQAVKDYEEGKVLEVYYLDSLKLNLIEIGEECKLINDILLEKEGSWDEILSKAYNLRISLTHYYKEISKEIIFQYLETRFKEFSLKIKELKEKFN